MRPSRRTLGLCAALVSAVLGAVAFGHSPTGMRLWARYIAPSCPFGGSGQALSAAQLDAAYRTAAQKSRGKGVAKNRFALSFKLEGTTRDDVLRWAAAHRATCVEEGSGLGLRCAVDDWGALPQSCYVGGGGSLVLRFDVNERLRSIVAHQRLTHPDHAVAALRRVLTPLQAAVGPPQRQHGELSEAYLGRGALTQVRRDFVYSNYQAEISATHMGKLGYIALSQTYTSLRD